MALVPFLGKGLLSSLLPPLTPTCSLYSAQSFLNPLLCQTEQIPLGVSALPPGKCGHVARLGTWWAFPPPSYPDCSINPPASSRVALPPTVPARKPKLRAQGTSDQNINWTPKSAAPPQTHHSRASPTLGPLDSLQVTLTLRRTKALLIPTKCEGRGRWHPALKEEGVAEVRRKRHSCGRIFYFLPWASCSFPR